MRVVCGRPPPLKVAICAVRTVILDIVILSTVLIVKFVVLAEPSQ
jgi:hypothetical protein